MTPDRRGPFGFGILGGGSGVDVDRISTKNLVDALRDVGRVNKYLMDLRDALRKSHNAIVKGVDIAFPPEGVEDLGQDVRAALDTIDATRVTAHRRLETGRRAARELIQELRDRDAGDLADEVIQEVRGQ